MSQGPSPPELERLAFLRDFHPDHLATLAALAIPVHWDTDEMIFREGTYAPWLFLVREGRVALELGAPSRQRTTILTVGSGEVFGWSSIATEHAKFASARAVVPTNAYAFDAAQVRALCERDHDFGYALTRRLLATVADRLKATRMQLLDLFASPAEHATGQGGHG